MQRLSSPLTFFYKRVFPVIWLGVLAAFVIIWGRVALAAHESDMLLVLIMFGTGTLFCFVLFKRLIFDLVDEVWLDGERLMVSHRGEQSAIALTDIINVNTTTTASPPRITLLLRTESARLGKTISFVPTGPRGFFSEFRLNPIAVDLIRRIDALRQRQA